MLPPKRPSSCGHGARPRVKLACAIDWKRSKECSPDCSTARPSVNHRGPVACPVAASHARCASS
nr:hypothetical protein [Deltaproteobacteria bacterium]